MGCETSKSEHQDDEDVQDGEEDFTDNQIDSIKSTWPLLTRDRQQTGTEMFRHIFHHEPNIKKLFQRNRDLQDEELLLSSEFVEHVENFMKTMDHVVETLDTNREETEHTLLFLGAKHATFDGFKDEYFHVYGKCMIDTWELVIGEEFIMDVKESWEVLCAYMTRYMREGFKLYIHDRNLDQIEEESTLLS